MRYTVTVGDRNYAIEINHDGEVLLDDQLVSVHFARVGETGLYSLLVDNESFEALAEARGDHWQVLLLGALYEIQVIDERTERLRSSAGLLVSETDEVAIKAPMPGLIVDVPVVQGQEVEIGDNLVILESMKMENELKAPRAGRVERVNVQAGDGVERDQVLIVLV